MVGPRSALFTPFKNLGLIIVDEFHDDSYYQRDLQPHYHARQAAIIYARLAGAVCLLGSATPDVASFYQADKKHWQHLKLPRRILAHRQTVQSQVERLGLASRYRDLQAEAEYLDLPPVQVVDMRVELKSGNRSIFSRDLQAAGRRARCGPAGDFIPQPPRSSHLCVLPLFSVGRQGRGRSPP